MVGNEGASGGSRVLRRAEPAVRPARSRDELEEAYRLVYQGFRYRSYIAESPSEMRLSIFNAFPGTVTFVSVLRGEVVASVTLVPDTEAGLPMDEIYREELQALRSAGRTVAEATMFADRRKENLRRTLSMLMRLMKRLFDYCTRVLEVNDLCITINPRHENFYEKRLLFKPLGELKFYPSVRNNPALAKRLNLDTVEQECRGHPDLWRRFFEDRTPVSVLTDRYRMDCDDLEYFMVNRTNALAEASAEQIRALREHYPDCPWESWLAP